MLSNTPICLYIVCYPLFIPLYSFSTVVIHKRTCEVLEKSTSNCSQLNPSQHHLSPILLNMYFFSLLIYFSLQQNTFNKDLFLMTTTTSIFKRDDDVKNISRLMVFSQFPVLLLLFCIANKIYNTCIL